jgi:predicted phosphodiesterase
MRALIVSDLHSNAEALRAVLSRVRRKRFDYVVCLGDFVGYGAQPNQVLDTMRTLRFSKVYIRGNHDRVAAGIDAADGFNPPAKHAALWTRDRLSAVNQRFLVKLATGPVTKGNVVVCHGSPHDEDEYVFNETHAWQVFAQQEGQFILYGHTHLPVVFATDGRGISGAAVRGEATFKLNPKLRYLINPGSVGQPRDRNPAASFALFDSVKLTVQFFRVPYDIAKTQDSIRKAGLPRILADRLATGT